MKTTIILSAILCGAFVFSISARAAPHSPDPGPDSDIEQIRQVVENYGEGLRTGDIELLKQTFHPNAIWTGYVGGDLIAAPIETMYQSLRSNPVPAVSGEPYAYEVKDINIVGETATADVVEHSFFGHDFLTRLHLVQVDNGWRITSKLFTVTGVAGNN
jgi:hypothetical protein